MITSARDSLLTSQFNAQAASDASFGTVDTAIATAKAAGQTNIIVNSITPALMTYLQGRAYEVRPTQTAGQYQIDWTAPTDASF